MGRRRLLPLLLAVLAAVATAAELEKPAGEAQQVERAPTPAPTPKLTPAQTPATRAPIHKLVRKPTLKSA